ncbi:hypothetical protein Patl1_34816 [Pistacia atlantica]|uniref:Uncharacterized protein n=1 Tax=Pistacia atlantica TaxID=434234 RepID=A0ACC0ZVW0_9ROSI|nr:hypothetical protein Patl1_34816 [Pistacia atlantica]
MVKPAATETSPSSSSSHSVSPLQTFLVHLILWSWLRRRILGSPQHLFHQSRLSSFAHSPSDLGYREPNCYSSLQLFSEKSRQILVFQSCGTRPTGTPCWGSFKCFRSYCFGCTCGHSVCEMRFVPAASVYGSLWEDWQLIFAHTKPNGSVDYMICLPAHGAVIGAWFGAWPMPLDWERPWQEWPICVSYGAMVGYLIGMVASFGFVLIRGRQQHQKGD